MIEGLSHITLIVKDLDRTTIFLTSIFDAEEVYASGEQTFSLSSEKFFLIGGVWLAVMEGQSQPGKTYDHIAFKIPEQEFELYEKRVQSLGSAVREGRSRVEGEGRSLYFQDYDGHLFELHTGTLEQRLERYRQPPEQPDDG
jgi:catechol 2,3-dioxygenase-like lactoylglutathione lyase family enzyme